MAVHSPPASVAKTPLFLLDRFPDQEPHDRQGAFALAFTLGGTLNRYVRHGAEINGWLLDASDLNDRDEGESVGQILAIVQVYPWPARGLSLKAGAGRAINSSNHPFESGSSGWGGTIGAGYDWPVGRSPFLTTRSIHDNAYAAGLLGTERIVLYDTLLSSYTKDEIAFVMGHEIGHRVLNHIWKGLALACALILAEFYLVDRTMRRVLAFEAAGRLRTGLMAIGDLASLPLMMLIVSIFLFVTLPIQSAYSRAMESEADQFGMRAVAHPEAGPAAFRKMATRNLADPDPPPLVEWFLYSHPSMGKRIRAAEEFAERHIANGP